MPLSTKSSHGQIMSVTSVLSSVAGVYSDQLPEWDGAGHELFVDITLNDVANLDLWPEVTLDGTTWYKVYAANKNQIMWTFSADFSGALLSCTDPSGNNPMASLPLFGHGVRWGVKPQITATTGADVDLSLEGFSAGRSIASAG